MIVSGINDKFDEWYSLTSVLILINNIYGIILKFTFLDYHESKLSLIAPKITPLPVNNQLIHSLIRPKSMSLKQSCYERS